ncbi:MAG: BlaI/MecI/CopY family transcriptional regulator [Pseudomonadota bacterium]
MSNKRHSTSIFPHALGELELAILEILWDTPDLSAKDIVQLLRQSRRLTMSTAQSSLESLRRKNLLTYSKDRQAFVYRATLTRPELLGRFVGDVIRQLHDGELDTILSTFVHVASNIHDQALDELEDLIREKRKRLKGGEVE